MRQLQAYCDTRPATTRQIDLTTMTLTLPGMTLAIDMRNGPRQQFLRGNRDSLSVLIQAGAEIRARLDVLQSQP